MPPDETDVTEEEREIEDMSVDVRPSAFEEVAL